MVTSSLFEVNNKLIKGASPLALAKSIVFFNLSHRRRTVYQNVITLNVSKKISKENNVVFKLPSNAYLR